MAGLVVGHDLLLVLGEHGGLLLLAGDDHVDGLGEVLLGHAVAAEAHGAQGGLVDDVGEVGSRGARRGLGDAGQVDGALHLDVVGVDLEDGLAAGEVGQLDGDAAVKAAGAQQGRVEGLGAVGGGQDDDALVVVEAVHLGEQLVQGLLALVVGVEGAVAPLAHGVDLVDEDDAGGLLVCLLEEVAHLGGAAANEHLDELGAGDLEERHAGLARHGLGHEGLAGSRRADEKRAARTACADLVVLVGLLEERDDLLQRLLGLVLAGDVLERDAGLLALDLLDVRLAQAAAHAEAAPAEVHGGAVIAHGLLHAAVEPPADEKEDHDGQAVGEQQVEPHVTGGVGDLAHHLDAMVLELLVEAVARAEDDGAVLLLRVARAGGEVELGVSLGLLDLGDLVLVDHGEEVGVADLLGLGVGESRVHGLAHGEVDDDCNEDVEQHRPSSLVLVHVHRAGTFRPWLSGQRAGPWVM